MNRRHPFPRQQAFYALGIYWIVYKHFMLQAWYHPILRSDSPFCAKWTGPTDLLERAIPWKHNAQMNDPIQFIGRPYNRTIQRATLGPNMPDTLQWLEMASFVLTLFITYICAKKHGEE